MFGKLLDWLQNHPPMLWIAVAAFLVLNVWFDLHHPGVALLDVVVLVVGFLAYFFARTR